MRRLLAVAAATAIVVALTPVPAPAAQRLTTSVSVSPQTLTRSPSESGDQRITITGDGANWPVQFQASPMYSSADRGGGGRCLGPNGAGLVQCTAGDGAIDIHFAPKALSTSYHNTATSLLVLALAPDPANNQPGTGTMRIRFKADVSVTSVGYSLPSSGDWSVTAQWASSGPDEAVSPQVQVSGVNLAGVPAGCTGQGVCSVSGSGGTLTFQIPRCTVLSTATVSISAASDDPSTGNNSRSAAAPAWPSFCGVQPPPVGGAGSGGGGGGGGRGTGAPGSPTTPGAPTTVDASGTVLPGLTVVAGGAPSRLPINVRPVLDARFWAAIAVAVSSLLIALGLILGWVVYQRRQRRNA